MLLDMRWFFLKSFCVKFDLTSLRSGHSFVYVCLFTAAFCCVPEMVKNIKANYAYWKQQEPIESQKIAERQNNSSASWERSCPDPRNLSPAPIPLVYGQPQPLSFCPLEVAQARHGWQTRDNGCGDRRAKDRSHCCSCVYTNFVIRWLSLDRNPAVSTPNVCVFDDVIRDFQVVRLDCVVMRHRLVISEYGVQTEMCVTI